MKKRKKQLNENCGTANNPVAKFAHQFNKPQVYADKTKYYRKAKHAKQEASPIILLGIIGEVSCFSASI